MRQCGPWRERISVWAIKDEHGQCATQPVSGCRARCDCRRWTQFLEGLLDLGAAQHRRFSSCQAVQLLQRRSETRYSVKIPTRLELLVDRWILVGETAVGARQRGDRSDVVRSKGDIEDVEVLSLAFDRFGLGDRN